MKKLAKFKWSALSLLPFSIFTTEALADERNTSVKYSQIHAELLQGNKTVGQVDALVPLLGSASNFAFVNLQAYGKSNNERTYGAGLGYRFLHTPQQAVYGVNAFYDQQHSKHKQKYQRFTVGLERLSSTWDLRGNYYGILGNKEKQIETLADTHNLVALASGTAFQINYHHIDEEVHGGYDLEVGHNLGLKNFKAYAGGYTFGKDLSGYKLRAKYTFSERFSINLQGQHDKARGGQFYAGLGISLGELPQTNSASEMLYSPVIRDMQVVTTEEQEMRSSLIENTKAYFVDAGATKGVGNGTPDNPMTLPEAKALATSGDIIYLESGTHVLPTSDETLVNDNNVSVIGAGSPLTVEGINFLPAGTAPTLEGDFTISHADGVYSGFNLSSAVTNKSAIDIQNDAQNVLIDNVNIVTSGNVDSAIYARGENVSFTYQNGSISGTGRAGYEAIYLDNSARMTLKNAHIVENGTDKNRMGVVLSGNSHAEINNSFFNDNKFGLRVTDGSQAVVADSIFSNNHDVGVSVEGDGTRLTMNGANQIINNGTNDQNLSAGLITDGGGTAVIHAGSTIYGNVGEQLEAKGTNSSIEIYQPAFFEGEQAGTRGEIEASEFGSVVMHVGDRTYSVVSSGGREAKQCIVNELEANCQ